MITILLPVHNDEKYIKTCLTSIINQTHEDFLCILGFNGTKDNSKENAYSTIKGDQRFLVRDFGDQIGKSKTLNKLLSEVKTEIICLIDADDEWGPTKLEEQLEVMGSINPDVIGTWCNYINEYGNFILESPISVSEKDADIKRLTISGNNQIINSSFMAKSRIIKEIEGWDETLPALEDYDMWVKLILKDCFFYNIQKPLVNHRIHSNSNFNSKNWEIDTHYILNKNLNLKYANKI